MIHKFRPCVSACVAKDELLNAAIEARLTHNHECMKTIEILSMEEALGAQVDVVSSPTSLRFAPRSTPCVADRAQAPTFRPMRLAFSASPMAAAMPCDTSGYPAHQEVLRVCCNAYLPVPMQGHEIMVISGVIILLVMCVCVTLASARRKLQRPMADCKNWGPYIPSLWPMGPHCSRVFAYL